MRFKVWIFIIMVGALSWFIASKWIGSGDSLPTPTETKVAQFVERPKTSPLKIFVQLKVGETSRMLNCYHGKCVPAAAPPSQAIAGVSNGRDWFYYLDNAGKDGNPFKTLKRYDLSSNKETTIVSQTDLTSPRDALISPDGQRVAFFSDNISDPAKQLTELWVYDSTSNNVTVVAENLYRPDIRSSVHWNSSSTCLWFLVNTAKRPDERLDMEVVSVAPVQVATPFSKIDWAKYAPVIDMAAIDVNADGAKLAMAVSNVPNSTKIFFADSKGLGSQASVRGSVPSIQWLQKDVAIYAAQDSVGFTFWQQNKGENRFVAHRAGVLRSARGDAEGNYITFILSEGANSSHLFSLHTLSGTVIDEGSLPYPSNTLSLIRVSQERDLPSGVSDITQELDDSEIAAFLDEHFGEIAGNSMLRPSRLYVTSDPNTVYVIYKTQGAEQQRILLKIKDAINAEWSILARYKAVKADWQKIEGADTPDPKPIRFYEWESTLKRWILKEDLSK